MHHRRGQTEWQHGPVVHGREKGVTELLLDERAKPLLTARNRIFPVLAVTDVPHDLGEAAQGSIIAPESGRASRHP
jgi:hypothetical protein